MSTIRASIVGVRSTVTTKGRLRVTWTHWHLTVYRGDMVLNTDDCRDWRTLMDSAVPRVEKYRAMEAQGVKLRSWREIVDEASE